MWTYQTQPIVYIDICISLSSGNARKTPDEIKDLGAKAIAQSQKTGTIFSKIYML